MPATTVKSTTVGFSNPIPVGLKNFAGVGAGILINITGTLTATLQLTGDGVNWNDHDTLTGLTASANGNLAFPVVAVRLHVTAYSSGAALLSLIQGEF